MTPVLQVVHRVVTRHLLDGAQIKAGQGHGGAVTLIQRFGSAANYSSRPYAANVGSYDEYAPAYRYGVDSYSRFPGRSFDDVETDLGRDWNSRRSSSKLEWEHAKHATRDAWHRLSDTVERATPGDSDRDGK